jgi:NAD(P)H-flavin reductase
MKNALCELLCAESISAEFFRLDFAWPGPFPKAGQFFMIKPKRCGFFLGRPISAFAWRPARPGEAAGAVGFLIARRGEGTRELAGMRPGECAELTGPLGNAWSDFLPAAQAAGGRPVALVGGGAGVAPLEALRDELREAGGPPAILHSGFRTDPRAAGAFGSEGPGAIVATEDGTLGLKGRIADFLEPEKYAAVCACGPAPMMKAAAAKCASAGVPCFVSLERRMACGVGACLGCAVKTRGANRRCCADGPIFDAREVMFDD